MRQVTKAIYEVFQQLPMKSLDDPADPLTDWKSQLKPLGTVEAFTGSEAIAKAREKFKYDFRFAKKLGKFPIVERMEVSETPSLYH